MFSSSRFLLYFGSDCIGSQEQEKYSSTLLEIANMSDSTMILLKQSIKKEFIDQIECNQKSSIFRGNSLTSKIITTFNKQISESYLKKIFLDLLMEMKDSKELISFNTK